MTRSGHSLGRDNFVDCYGEYNYAYMIDNEQYSNKIFFSEETITPRVMCFRFHNSAGTDYRVNVTFQLLDYNL